jgi:hypothetical protein
VYVGLEDDAGKPQLIMELMYYICPTDLSIYTSRRKLPYNQLTNLIVDIMAKLNYIEQFREIALHPIVKFEVVAVRLCVLLASIHYGFDCWWMDMVLAAYLLFVFNRFIPHLLLLVLWTIGKITWLEHTQFKVEMVMLEVVLLCCLVFRKFQPQNKVKAPLLIENQM